MKLCSRCTRLPFEAQDPMQPVVYLSPAFAVTSALTAADFAEAARLGFRSVLNHRPDGEEDGQLPALAAARHAAAAGLGYRHLPASKLDLFTDEVVEGMIEALRGLDGPVLAHCKSGLRSAIVWAAAEARRRPVEEILAVLRGAGFDLDFLRDELDTQADRQRFATELHAPLSQPEPRSEAKSAA
jgi:sulfide:quinone oxidoreductase